MGLILISLLQRERDELERPDGFAAPHHQTIVNGQREILQSRGTPIVSNEGFSNLESQTQPFNQPQPLSYYKGRIRESREARLRC